ncbi:MAG: S9 family peptidase [Candidatus Delongbacteria bacterium]|nr:S9 family peptidase [Candidatus Delongbacteria bacterium]MBN2835201.1 S9 family peptidase [Candidatus Delongbacteria bacterium]
MEYPFTRESQKVDNYFGVEITDPYDWLEDDHSEETKEWVRQQQGFTENYLSKIPEREGIKQRLLELANYEKYSTPFKKGDYYYFYYNSGVLNQMQIYRQKGLNGEKELVLDPNLLSKDGTTSAYISEFSPCYKFCAITISQAGSDWSELRVFNLEKLDWENDLIKWSKFSGTSWDKDGFLYSRYDEPSNEGALKDVNENHRVFYHKLGTNQEDDILIFEDKRFPKRFNSAYFSNDKSVVFLNVSEGTDGSEIRYKKVGDSEFKTIVKGFDTNSYTIGLMEDKVLVQTNLDAPNYKLVLIDPINPNRENWIDVVKEDEFVLESSMIVKDKLVLNYLKDACNELKVYNLKGDFVRNIEFDSKGMIAVSADEDQSEFFVKTLSFTDPGTTYRLNIENDMIEEFKKTITKSDLSNFVTEQIFFTSKDGTKVPMFIVRRRDIKLDGNNPVMLYGYGGFNVSLTPSYAYTIIPFVEKGGIYAQVTLRGGGEYGEEWHKAGMKFNKQNVFDDFISAAEFLIKENYTNSNKIAIRGGSNGGLLVGACMTQRPDLFRVAIPEVGVLDMLKFHKFTIGWGWAVEYGSSENEDEFKYILNYSPLHNIKEGVKYPATMIKTADHDDRVVPAHSFKFAAELQKKSLKAENPYLIRIDIDAGHGGSSLAKLIDSTSDTLAFIYKHLEV